MKEQQFDTIHLMVNADTIKPTKNKWYANVKIDPDTAELLEDYTGAEQMHWNGEATGISHVTFVPTRNLYDIRFSAKILGEDYAKGICNSTLPILEQKLLSAGFADNIDFNSFILDSSVRVCDNTFNIKLDEPDLEHYLDALDLMAVGGKKTKKQAYKNDKSRGKNIESVVIGKNTQKLQKITFYDKIAEIRASVNMNNPKWENEVLKNYGAPFSKLHSDFAGTLRTELRVTNQAHIKKFFGINKGTKNNATFSDILDSKKNAILHQWTNFINYEISESVMKYLDKTMNEKKLMKTENWVEWTRWKAMEDWVIEFNGDSIAVRDKIQKLFVGDKRMSKSIIDSIEKYCREYKRMKLQAEKGTLVTQTYSTKYKEIRTKIKSLI